MKWIIGTGIVVLFLSCQKTDKLRLLSSHQPFISEVKTDKEFFYSVSSSENPAKKKNWPIGIFDSGVGGLTVFDAILNADLFNSQNEYIPDGIRDFIHEQFIYFADKANMPYSNYIEENKKDLLVEHILKDALFLLGNKYHCSAGSPEVGYDKLSVKTLVIACNTATAYGKEQIEELINLLGIDVKVIGVIDAGCKGGLELIGTDQDATIAVLATPATVASRAYLNTLNNLKETHKGKIHIVQQGGKGLHESIDHISAFIRIGEKKPYREYQGPSPDNIQYKIDSQLFPHYNFDTTNHSLLYNKCSLKSSDTVQINSIENYARYHVVSLVDQLKNENHPPKLKAIILGCTHYPYATKEINNILDELKRTSEYGNLLSDTIYLVDPALNTAKELYLYLSNKRMFNDPNDNRIQKSLFFISVPNTFSTKTETDKNGNFTYDYQYKKRNINELTDYTRIVPFSNDLFSDDEISIIHQRLPATYELLKTNLNKN